jgi:hypothetical protein
MLEDIKNGLYNSFVGGCGLELFGSEWGSMLGLLNGFYDSIKDTELLEQQNDC